VNATAITAETTRATAAEVVNATAITAETTRATAAEGVNATAIASLNDTVFSIDLEPGSVGIAGVIEKHADGTIQLGGNTFFFNEVTDTISTTSGDINLDADVDITGDLTIAGLTGDVASRINSNSSAIANNSSRIESNQENIEQNTRGIAMVAALQHTTVLPGMTNAFDLSAAHFEGETGLALNFARRINENVQINFGAASTTDFDESVIKAGIGVQW
jgi:hypothetical protein